MCEGGNAPRSAPHARCGAGPERTRDAERGVGSGVGGARLEGARDLLGTVALDHVADLEVVEVLDADAALEALLDLLHVVLEAAERAEVAVVDLDRVADHADLGAALERAAADVRAGDGADARDLEGL